MRNIFLLTIILIVISGGIFFAFKKIGDIRPAILPPAIKTDNTPSSNYQTGESLSFAISLPPGFEARIFAKNLNQARDLEFSDGGTLLVSDLSGQIYALPDRDKNGRADQTVTLLSGLNHPHGLAFYKSKLYIAEETRLARYNFDEENLKANLEKVLFKIPGGGRHFTRSIVIDDSGKLYLSIGSTCDVCNEKNPWYGSIIASDTEGNNPHVFTTGLRNSVFLTLHNDQVWATEMGRDFLGDNAPPDEINIISAGDNYGWPKCFGNKIHDNSFDKNVYVRNPCDDTKAPVFEIPAHSAPLGLTFIKSEQFPKDWQGDLIVAYHGSWNKSTPTGYKVVHMKVEGDKILSAEDFITGFLQGSQAAGRPVDLIFDKGGSLYISDDKSGTIYKITRQE